MTKLRVVLDTNIYLSGIIFGGNCRHIIDLVIERKINAITSPAILLELSSKLLEKFHWHKDQVIATIKTITKTAKLVYPKTRLKVIKADKNDNKIIEAGVVGMADYIITGDKHLIQIKRFRNIKIVSPDEFLSEYFQ